MTKKTRKLLIALTLLVVLVGVVVGLFLWIWSKGGSQRSSSGIETVSYITQLPFDPEGLEDITETAEGDTVHAGLESPKAQAIIPPNSKMRLAFESVCMDRVFSYGVPDENVPVVFSYEKADMPLFEEITTYIFAHPGLDWAIVQTLFWDLSTEHATLWGIPSADPLTFDGLLEPEQTALLGIDSNAQEKVDSYEFYRDISVKDFSFEGDLPEEVVAQPISGSELYAKVVETEDYYYTELEVYNPSDEAQVFSIFNEDGGILTFVPKGWAKKVTMWKEEEELTFGVASGKFDIRENIFRTPVGSGAVIELEDGSQKTVEPNTELSFDQLKQMVGEEEAGSWWGRLVRDLFRPRPAGAAWGKNKFQMKIPTMTTGRRG